jgi:Protein of unknown function (DUF3551)
MIRLIAAGTLLAATLASHSAFAQGTYAHHTYCLKSGASQTCAFESMAQCEAAKKGNADTCVQNSAPMNH